MKSEEKKAAYRELYEAYQKQKCAFEKQLAKMKHEVMIAKQAYFNEKLKEIYSERESKP